MNIDQLKNFIKVAEIGHITNAAEILNISEPALSKSISRLEDELGINLFNRVGRSIVINKNGSTFYEYVYQALQKIDEGIDMIQAMQEKDHSVQLQSMPLILFPGLLDKILTSYPKTNILSSALPPYVLKDNLLSGKTDLCFTANILKDSNISQKVLNVEELLLVLPEYHPLHKKKFITAEDLLNEKFIISNEHSNLNRYYNYVFDAFDEKPQISHSVTVVHETLEYILKGRGIALLPSSLYEDLLKRQTTGTIALHIYDKDLNIITLKQTLYWRKKNNAKAILGVKKILTDYFTG